MPLPFLQYHHTVRPTLLIFLYALTGSTYLLRNRFSIYPVTGTSMIPFLSPTYSTTGTSDFIYVRKNIRLSSSPVQEGGSGAQGELKRGMIVTFLNPMSREYRVVVKRIVGLEGDVVVPLGVGERGKVMDGRGRCVGPAAVEEAMKAGREAVTVPYGHIWVEGDNHEDTIDSNDYGPISKSLVLGVAESIVYPRRKWGRIKWETGWDRMYGDRVRKARMEEAEMVPEEWSMQ